MEDIFIAIPWPDVQNYMSEEDFDKNSILINNSPLYEEYGDSAYMVRQTWVELIDRKNELEQTHMEE